MEQVNGERSELEHYTSELRSLPGQVQRRLGDASESALRRSPAAGEWSAIEVLGHLLDKLTIWSERLQRIVDEDEPLLPAYDQDAAVREHGYAQADVTTLFGQFAQACERFALRVEALDPAALERAGVHVERGRITARDCVTLPLESLPAHLAQLHAALAASHTR